MWLANCIRAVRFPGVITAQAVFVWRYVNVPQNWEYVVSWPSIILLTLTVIPEIIYPFLFRITEQKMIRAATEEKRKVK